MMRSVVAGRPAKRRHSAAHVAALLAATCLIAAFACAAHPSPAHAAMPAPASAEIPVKVSIPDGAPADQDFLFTMEPAEGETTLPDANPIAIHGAGSASFRISLGHVGAHRYTVRQIVGTASGWTYDSRVYDVLIRCLWDEKTNSLYAIATIGTDKGKDGSCDFDNGYDAPSPPPPALSPPSQTGVDALLGKTGDAAPVLALALIAALAAITTPIAKRRLRDSCDSARRSGKSADSRLAKGNEK